MSRVPRIRFKGFEEDWEQRKLGEIYTKLVERNIELLPFKKILSVSTMTYKGDGNGAAEESLSSYKRLRVGDIAFEGHTSKDFRYGRFVLNDTGDGIMSPRFSALRPISYMPIKFWKYYIHYEPIMKKILVNSTKSGTMMNELVVEEFLKEILLVPKKHEQQKIGRFFYGIDHLITLHQRKLEKLKIIKKSMLENIFPQNGEKTPKIRFSGFTNDWEQRKFGELFLEKRDKTEIEDEDILLSCAITGIYLNSELFSHFRGTSNIGYLKIKKNDLILSAQNLHLGNANVNLLFEHGIISPAYKVYELNKCDQYFVQSWVKKDSTKDFFLNATTEGASQCRKNIDWCILNNQLITIPSLYEQIRIGKLFHCLNHLITLHQSKLEKLQKIKKSMLESMFV